MNCQSLQGGNVFEKKNKHTCFHVKSKSIQNNKDPNKEKINDQFYIVMYRVYCIIAYPT